MLGALRDDALRSIEGGFLLRVSLPWIRSLPLWSLVDLTVQIDGHAEERVQVLLGERALDPSDLAAEHGWWFVQDRLRLRGKRALSPGDHEVGVGFTLVVPYLQAGPDAPLGLPFRFDRRLTLNSGLAVPNVSRDVA